MTETSATKILIDNLRDDEQYYGEFGRQFLSNSDIGVLLKNPSHFRVKREDNKAFVEGRYFHQSLLEPDKVKNFKWIDASSRNTKKYKEESEGKVRLLKSEKEHLDNLLDKVRNNDYFVQHIYKDGNRFEEPAIGEVKGRMFKGKADILCNDMIIDIKTTSNIADFKYSAKRYGYNSQAYIYSELFRRPMVFFVVDKTDGSMGVFDTSSEFMWGGEQRVEQGLEVYEKFFGDNATDDIRNYFLSDIL